jgi:hypothetical protein
VECEVAPLPASQPQYQPNHGCDDELEAQDAQELPVAEPDFLAPIRSSRIEAGYDEHSERDEDDEGEFSGVEIPRRGSEMSFHQSP